MTSRGVDERRAKNMLVEGFFVPVLAEIAVAEFRDDIEDLIRERLEGPVPVTPLPNKGESSEGTA
jgi:Fe-S cluster assembly protein SufD